MFELKYGTRATPGQVERTLAYPAYIEASGLELDECMRILGRRASGPIHTFSAEATEEILLNWSR